MNLIPESHRDLLAEKTCAFAYLATLMADGSPQLTPLWFDVDGDHILVNTAKGRVKDKNMRARKHVAVLIADPQAPFYRFIQIRGRVVDVIEDGALEHINKLSLRYDGNQWKPVEGQTRVIFKILPEKIYVHS
jgi:PPOX class probable F420-dependent enzyme